MTIALIRKALETKLASITPAVDTAFENVAYTPASGVPYQRANLLPNTPDDGQIGSKIYFERGLFQVTLCYQMGVGPAAGEARAQLIKDTFKRGTSLIEGPVIVIITNAPSVSSAMVDGDRYCTPISVRYQCQIATP